MLRRDRENPDLNCRAARCMLERGRLEDAEQHAATALRSDPNCADACLLLSRICERRGSTFQAQIYYQKALSMNPDLALGFDVPPEPAPEEPAVEAPDVEDAAGEEPPPEIQEPVELVPTDNDWYYYIQGEPLGPVSIEEMLEKAAAGVVNAETYVYRDRWDEIKAAGAVKELQGSFAPVEEIKPVSIVGESGVISIHEILNDPAMGARESVPAPVTPEDDLPDEPFKEAPRRRRRYRQVQSRMTNSLLAILLFPPFGIVALYFSFRVKQCLGANSRSGAARASKAAQAWYNAALVVFAAGAVIVLMVYLFSVFVTPPAHPAK